MTPVVWLALAGAACCAALPSPVHVRAAALSAGGRLAAAKGRTGTAAPIHPRSASAQRFGVALTLVPVPVPVLVCWRGGVALGVAVAALVGLLGLLTRDARRSRLEQRHRRELVLAVRLLAGELAAGTGPAEALGAAAAAGPTVAAVFGDAGQEQARGGDAAAVLDSAGGSELRGLAAAWRVADTTGAPLAEVVDRVAADLAAADTRRRAVAVVLAGPRASAALLAGLPLLGIALGTAMGAEPVRLLAADPAGRLLCCAGVLLDVGGILWMRRIILRAQRP